MCRISPMNRLHGGAAATMNIERLQVSFGGASGLFPCRLYDLLEQAELNGLESIISWTSNGRAFKVHNPTKLSALLSFFFPQQTKYRSFTRQLAHWSFSKIQSGPDRGALHHPQFVRGENTKSVLQNITREAFKQKSLGLNKERVTPARQQHLPISQYLKKCKEEPAGQNSMSNKTPLDYQVWSLQKNDRHLTATSDNSSLEVWLDSLSKIISLESGGISSYSTSSIASSSMDDIFETDECKLSNDLGQQEKNSSIEEGDSMDFEGRRFFLVDLDIAL